MRIEVNCENGEVTYHEEDTQQQEEQQYAITEGQVTEDNQ